MEAVYSSIAFFIFEFFKFFRHLDLFSYSEDKYIIKDIKDIKDIKVQMFWRTAILKVTINEVLLKVYIFSHGLR